MLLITIRKMTLGEKYNRRFFEFLNKQTKNKNVFTTLLLGHLSQLKVQQNLCITAFE